MSARAWGQRSGQSTAEATVIVSTIVLAITAMSMYVRRAVEGNLYQSATVHGQQFNPGEAWTETKTLGLHQDLEIDYRGDRPQVVFECCNDPDLSGGGDADPLPDLPSAVHGGGVVFVKVNAGSNWTMRRNADYQTNN